MKPKRKTLSEIIAEWNEIKRQYADDKKFLKLWNSLPTDSEKANVA